MQAKFNKIKSSPCFKWTTLILLFIFIGFLSHLYFIYNNVPFVSKIGYDTTSQMLPGTALIENAWCNGTPFWSWSLGLGGDIFTEMSYYYSTSPFFFICWIIKSVLGIAGSTDYMLLFKTALYTSILKQSIIMLLMYTLLHKEGKKAWLCIISAIIYGCSPWFLKYDMSFNFMTDAMIWLPVTIMALKAYQDKGKWFPLSLSVAFTALNSFYFGYISCLFYSTLFVIFAFQPGQKIKEYLKTILKLLAISIIGLMISACFLLPSVYGLFASMRTPSSFNLSIFPSMFSISTLPDELLTTNGLFMLPPILLLTFALKYKDTPALCKKKTVLSVFWVIALILPLVQWALCGFGYIHDRWYYVPVFVFAYSIPDFFEELNNQKVSIKAGFFTLVALGIIYYTAGTRGYSSDFFTLNNAFLLFFSAISIILFISLKYIQKTILIRLFKFSIVFCIIVCTLYSNYAVSVSSNLRELNKEEINNICLGTDDAKTYGLLIPASSEFYRIHDAKTDSVNFHRENMSWLFPVYSDTVYNSMVNGRLYNWLMKIYNIQNDYSTSAVVHGFDKRYFLETAWGVKYKLNEENYNHSVFAEKELENGSIVLVNQYDVGIDIWYDSAITERDFSDLNFAERDAVILQTAVIDSENITKLKNKKLDVVTTSQEITANDLECVNCSWQNGLLEVHKNSKIIFHTFNNNKNGEYLLTIDWENTESKHTYMKINNRDYLQCYTGWKFGYDVTPHTYRLDGDISKIEIILPEGTYRLDYILLQYNSFDKIDRWIDLCNKYNLENLYVNSGKIAGTINNTEPGILALSIPFSEGWTCYVDDKKTPIVSVNGEFSGIELSAGSHAVEFRYRTPMLYEGIGISILALILSFLLWLIPKKYKRKHKLNSSITTS